MNNKNSGNSKGLFLPDGSGDPVLEFGEPFIAAAEVPVNRLVNVQGSTAARSSVFLLFSFRGQGKEGISDLSHLKGDRTDIPLSEKEGLIHRPKEPTYKVIEAGGEFVSRSSFEYG